jgi:dipeptide/tripeptide permease
LTDKSNFLDLANFSGADFERVIWSALRLIGFAVVIATPVLWWKLGWQSALLLLVGALISGSGIFEWLRLMTALMVRMDTSPDPKPARPMAPVLIGFFLRLLGALALLYVSLKFLHGSVYALIAGLALGVFALTIEGVKLLRSWTT